MVSENPASEDGDLEERLRGGNPFITFRPFPIADGEGRSREKNGATVRSGGPGRNRTAYLLARG